MVRIYGCFVIFSWVFLGFLLVLCRWGGLGSRRFLRFYGLFVGFGLRFIGVVFVVVSWVFKCLRGFSLFWGCLRKSKMGFYF